MNKYAEKQNELLDQSTDVIYNYSDRWVESHHTFAKRMWPNKIRRADEAYNRWKFKGPVNGDVEGLLLAVIDNQVVGQLGLIPSKLVVAGKVYPAQWACDLMVDDRMRKRGIGSMLHAVGMNRGMVTLGSEPSSGADATSAKLGFKPLNGPHKLLFPLEISDLINLVIETELKFIPQSLSFLLQPLNKLRISVISGQKKDNNLVSGNLQSIADSISTHQSKLDIPYILHDKEFLAWRFNVPYKPVIRTLMGNQGGYAIYETTPGDCYVYDWFSSSEQENKALLLKILADALESKSKNIMIYANNDHQKSFLTKFGFLKMRTPMKVIYHSKDPILSDYDQFHYCIYDSDGNL